MIRRIPLLLTCAATCALPLAGQQTASNATATGPRVSGEVALIQLEIGQGIQNEGSSVPVLAGRNTLVRAFLRPESSEVLPLKGTLQITNHRTGITARYTSANAVSLAGLSSNFSELRADPAHSLNFLIPASDLQDGDVEFGLIEMSSPTGQQVTCSNCQTLPLIVRVARAPTLRLVLVGLRFLDPQTGRRYMPRLQDFTALESWLRRTYPAYVRVSRRIVDIKDRPLFPCDTANARLAAIRASDMRSGADFRTHYYGLVYDGGGTGRPFFMQGCAAGIPDVPNPTVVASGPAGADEYEWDTDSSYADWYGGHEIAHTLGRSHIGFCDQSKEDSLYPYDNGQLSSSPATFQGWDPGDPAVAPGSVLPGEKWHDVMSYCDYQWVSDYTFKAILDRLASEERSILGGFAPMGPGGAPAAEAGPPQTPSQQPTHVSVIAIVNLTRGTGTIQEITPTSPTTGAKPPADGRATIRLLNSTGEVLGSYPAWLRQSTDILPGRDTTASVQEVIPFSAATKRVELLLDGRVLDTRESGESSPTVQVVRRPAAGPVRPGAPVTFTWSARDPDNDRLTYTVRVKFEGSPEWETFATGLADRQITLDREQLMGRRVSQLEVVASDGVRVDEVRVVSP